jgi:hypothetical protein
MPPTWLVYEYCPDGLFMARIFVVAETYYAFRISATGDFICERFDASPRPFPSYQGVEA